MGKRQKSEGSRAFTQATEETEKKTTQHCPCSYLSGTAVPRIAYSETRKLREQQGRAESWPFGKKRNNPQQTNPKGKEKNHGTAAVLGLGDMSKSIQNILVNLYFQMLCKQMALPLNPSDPPSACGKQIVVPGKVVGASQHQPLAARTQIAPSLCPEFCSSAALASKRFTGWAGALPLEKHIHLRMPSAEGEQPFPSPQW